MRYCFVTRTFQDEMVRDVPCEEIGAVLESKRCEVVLYIVEG